MISKETRLIYRDQIYKVEMEKLLLEYYVAQLARKCKRELKQITFVETEEDIAWLEGVCGKMLKMNRKLANPIHVVETDSKTKLGVDNYPTYFIKDSTAYSDYTIKQWLGSYSSMFVPSVDNFYIPDWGSLTGSRACAVYLKPLPFALILTRWIKFGCPINSYISFLMSVATTNPDSIDITFPNPTMGLGVAVNVTDNRIGISDGDDVYNFAGSHIESRGSNWRVVI